MLSSRHLALFMFALVRLSFSLSFSQNIWLFVFVNRILIYLILFSRLRVVNGGRGGKGGNSTQSVFFF